MIKNIEMKKEHWLISQEIKWRTIACGVWTWLMSYILFASFLFVWSLSPYQHIYVIHEYFLLMFTFRTWITGFCIACLSVAYVKMYADTFSVVSQLKSTRFAMMCSFFQPTNIMFALCHTCISCLIMGLISTLSSSRFSSIYTRCDPASESYSCINESCFVFLLFGGVVGLANFTIDVRNCGRTLVFPAVQQGRFLSVKCHIVNIITKSAATCALILRYFVIFYYLIGFIPRNLLSTLLNSPNCGDYLFSMRNVFVILQVAWALWISGTFVLALQNLSWHLFNVYYTQRFSFPIDSVFPEDIPRLLPANMSNKQPLLVQHLSFQYLAFVSQHSLAKRKQIFMLRSKFGDGRMKWDIIADECLARVNVLTETLKNYQLNILFLTDPNAKKVSKSFPTASQGDSSMNAGNLQSLTPLPNLRRRLLRPTPDSNQNSNATYSEITAIDDFAGGTSQFNTSALLNGSLPVPTPKLWTQQVHKGQRSVTDLQYGSSQDFAQNGNISMKVTGDQQKNLGAKIQSSLTKMPIVSYFVTKLSDRVAAIVFTEHCVYEWAIQSISFLAVASFKEDEYGLVQRRLHEILAALLDLLVVLEKNCKLSVTSSSTAVFSLLRQQHNLKIETKSAIYRITNTFAKHLESIQISPEHKRRLGSFVAQKE